MKDLGNISLDSWAVYLKQFCGCANTSNNAFISFLSWEKRSRIYCNSTEELGSVLQKFNTSLIYKRLWAFYFSGVSGAQKRSKADIQDPGKSLAFHISSTRISSLLIHPATANKPQNKHTLELISSKIKACTQLAYGSPLTKVREIHKEISFALGEKAFANLQATRSSTKCFPNKLISLVGLIHLQFP